METQEIRHEATRMRRQFADQFESLDEGSWNAASWCEGWQVRDVLAHLVWGAEATYASMTADMFRVGFRPDRAVDGAAKRMGHVPVPELTARLRSATGGIRLPGFPVAMGLGDVLVHSADAFRPLGMSVDAPAIDAVTVLEAYWPRSKTVFHEVPHRGRRLKATDIEWEKGDGPEVSGTAMDLLLLVANRRQVLPSLEGPGLVGI